MGEGGVEKHRLVAPLFMHHPLAASDGSNPQPWCIRTTLHPTELPPPLQRLEEKFLMRNSPAQSPRGDVYHVQLIQLRGGRGPPASPAPLPPSPRLRPAPIAGGAPWGAGASEPHPHPPITCGQTGGIGASAALAGKPVCLWCADGIPFKGKKPPNRKKCFKIK